MNPSKIFVCSLFFFINFFIYAQKVTIVDVLPIIGTYTSSNSESMRPFNYGTHEYDMKQTVTLRIENDSLILKVGGYGESAKSKNKRSFAYSFLSPISELKISNNSIIMKGNASYFYTDEISVGANRCIIVRIDTHYSESISKYLKIPIVTYLSKESIDNGNKVLRMVSLIDLTEYNDFSDKTTSVYGCPIKKFTHQAVLMLNTN